MVEGWVTAREAARMLEGRCATREHARLLLRAGLAGPSFATPVALFYDAREVGALAARLPVSTEEIVHAWPEGLYVARLARDTPVDVTAPWADQVAAVSVVPAMPPMTLALLQVSLRAQHGFPWVATLCGHVVLVASAHGIHSHGDGPERFDLRQAEGTVESTWSRGLVGRPLPTRRGRPWLVLRPGRAGLSGRGGA